MRTEPAGLRTDVVDDLAALDPVVPEWDALAVAASLPLSAPGWLLAWWRSIAPPDAGLRVVTVRDGGGSLVGLAPFFVVREGGLAHYKPLGAEDMGLRNVPLAAPGHEVPVAREIAGALDGASPSPGAVHLSQVDVGSPWPLLLTRAWPGLFPPRRERVREGPAPTVHLDAESYDEWFAAKSSSFRQAIRRYTRKLEELGARTWVAETHDELETALGHFHRLHSARWGEGSPLATEAGHRMMLDAGHALLGAGRFRVWCITIDDRPVTVQIFVAAGDEYVYWNGGWDPEYFVHSPALVGVCAGIRDAFERGARRVDFGEGDHPYKARFTSHEEPIEWFRLYPRGVRYPRTLVVTAPARARRAARSLVDRLPDPVRARVMRLAGREDPAPEDDGA